MSMLVDMVTLDPNLEIIARAGDASQKDTVLGFRLQ